MLTFCVFSLSLSLSLLLLFWHFVGFLSSFVSILCCLSLFLYYFYLIIFFDYVLFLYFLLLILYPFFAFLSLYLSRSVSLQASYFDFAFILSLDLLSRSHSLGVPRLAVFFLVFIIFHNYLHFVFFLSLCLACTSSFPFANRVSVCVCCVCVCCLCGSF